MYARAPQTLVRVNIAHASQHALIQQQRFDVRASCTNSRAKFFLRRFQRIEPEFAQHAFVRRTREHSHSSKPPNVGVTKLATIVKSKKNMCMRHYGNFRWTGNNLAGHTQMN